MKTPAKKRSRGRPSGVTPEQLRIAILDIQGKVPTLDDLCDKLAVQKTTLYKYIRGQEALVQQAADIVMAESRIPAVTSGMHWAQWARLYAGSQLKGFQRYPVLLEQLTPHPRQMKHLEEAILALVECGLDTVTALYTCNAMINIAVGAASAYEHGLMPNSQETADKRFHDAVRKTPHDLPLLRSLVAEGYASSGEPVFEDNVCFILAGIAKRRGESLPAELDRTSLGMSV
ncbi:MAG: AcrR family transcriptional regulator [Halioglobus sp.]|jgi:AcrR family transcriptional regulator